MSVAYSNFCGKLLHENRAGIQSAYVSDSLGSVVAQLDSGGNALSEMGFWPYGEVASQSGTNTSPWGFVGARGYYSDDATLRYVRMRTLDSAIGQWASVDPLWPDENPYEYAHSEPIGHYDLTGLASCPSNGDDPCIGVTFPKLKSGQDAGGTITCSDGKCCACVNPEFGPGTPAYDCTLAHEKQHCANAGCPITSVKDGVACSGPCKGCSGNPSYPPYPDRGRDECIASDVQLTCLKNYKCSDDECQHQVETWIIAVCEYAQLWCPQASEKYKFKNKDLCKQWGIDW